MRKMLFAIMLFLPFMVRAQSSNCNRLVIGIGALYERGFDVTLSVEHETRY